MAQLLAGSAADKRPLRVGQTPTAPEIRRRMPMLARFIVRAIFAAVGLWIAAQVAPGVSFDSAGSLIAAAVLLGIVNAFVRPVVFLLTLPLTILTLGLFLLVVNALMIGLVSVLLGGFHVHGLVAGIVAAIITGVTSWVGHMLLGREG
jgi:putative membrane protein